MFLRRKTIANTKSALKRIKTSEKRRQRNAAVRSSTKTFVKKARAAIIEAPEDSAATVLVATSALDRAAQKGVIHRNNAARRKSRLMKQLNQARAQAILAAQQVEEAAKPAKPKRKPRASTAKKS